MKYTRSSSKRQILEIKKDAALLWKPLNHRGGDGGKGRFFDDVVKGIFFCEETSKFEFIEKKKSLEMDEYTFGIFMASLFDKSFRRVFNAEQLFECLLYLFPSVPIKKGDMDKSEWEINLQCKESFTVVNFYDYKGSASFTVTGTHAERSREDLLALLNMLLTCLSLKDLYSE